MSYPTRAASLLAGARDMIPMLIGAAPFGLIYGALVSATPMAPWHGQLMSLTVFAGSSQFIAAGLMATGVGYLVLWITTFIVNLRHVLYAANLLPHVQHLPLRWRMALGFVLTDEAFAVTSSHYHKHPDDPLGHWYFLGAGLSMFFNWQVATLAGLIFGAAFPSLQTMGLDFAMVVTFLAIVVPQMARMPWAVATIAAGASAYVLRDLPYKLGLLSAVAIGIVAGMLALYAGRRKTDGRNDSNGHSGSKGATGGAR